MLGVECADNILFGAKASDLLPPLASCRFFIRMASEIGDCAVH
jgi:hypothetical protein